MAADRTYRPGAGRRGGRYPRLFISSPAPALGIPLVLGLNVVIQFALWPVTPNWTMFLETLVLVQLVPVLVAVFATGPIAVLLGGQISLKRSVFLAITTSFLVLPIALVARGGLLLFGGFPTWVPDVILLIQGATLWFRHLSLYGLSRPSHGRTLPVSILPSVFAIAGLFVLVPVTTTLGIEAVVYLALGFACSVLLIRAIDRPLRREFGTPGTALLRPFLDHISGRSPEATRFLESFFKRFSLPVDLRVSIVKFVSGSTTKAAIALPTVHPGPFGAIGASDLPRKLDQAIAGEAGVLLVPHTPCDHDLDLPSTAEVEQIIVALKDVSRRAEPTPVDRSSPLVAPRPDSFARAQLLGPVTLVVLSQAPGPTDDIAFAVVDPVWRQLTAGSQREILLIDAHNSYVEAKGDLSYGTPGGERMAADIVSAVEAAEAAGRPGPIEVGVAARSDYTVAGHGIGPEGIRAFVVRAAGKVTAYVLIDGNNLLQGLRAPILDALRPFVDDAEVMTTDNHVVHEAGGSINPVGERYDVRELSGDIAVVVRQAVADLAPCDVAAATTAVRGVPVLVPGFTARLLTALGDTVSAFSSAGTLSFLLLMAASLVTLLAAL